MPTCPPSTMTGTSLLPPDASSIARIDAGSSKTFLYSTFAPAFS